MFGGDGPQIKANAYGKWQYSKLENYYFKNERKKNRSKQQHLSKKRLAVKVCAKMARARLGHQSWGPTCSKVGSRQYDAETIESNRWPLSKWSNWVYYGNTFLDTAPSCILIRAQLVTLKLVCSIRGFCFFISERRRSNLLYEHVSPIKELPVYDMDLIYVSNLLTDLITALPLNETTPVTVAKFTDFVFALRKLSLSSMDSLWDVFYTCLPPTEYIDLFTKEQCEKSQ